MHFSALEGAPENLRNASIPIVKKLLDDGDSKQHLCLASSHRLRSYVLANESNESTESKGASKVSCFRICINFFFDKSFFNKDLIRCLDMPNSLFF